MPLYEYECEACGHRFEVVQKFSDPPIDKCSNCGRGPVRKLLSAPAIQFKGSGWYVTDYARKGSSAAGRSEKAETKEGGSGKAADKTAESSAPTATPKSTTPKSTD